MKRRINILFIKVAVTILWTLPVILCAQIKEKNYHKTIATTESSRLSIVHERGPLFLESSTDGQIHVDLQVRITGKDQESMNLLLEGIEIGEKISGSAIEIKTETLITSWNQSLGKTRVKLNNGNVAYDINELDMTLTVKVPNLAEVTLKNKYEKIDIKFDINSNVSVDLYSGEFSAKNIDGLLNLKAKYSDLNFTNFSKGVFDLYESKLTGGDTKGVDISSKYSSVRLQSCDELLLDSYEDQYSIGNIMRSVKITDKYSHIDLGHIADAELHFYETEFEIKSGRGIIADCKYGSVKTGNLLNLELTESYETDFVLQSIEDVIVKNDKYGSFDIGLLTRSFKLVGYESNVEIVTVANSLAEIYVDSKYDKMSFGLPQDLGYQLDAELKYGSVSYHEGIFHKIDRQQKGDQLTIKADLDDSVTKPKIVLRAYETDFTLR